MYIITGATGFIGSNLLAEMELRGYRNLVAVDSFGTDSKWKNVAKRSAVRFLSPNQLEDFISSRPGQIDAVLHLGAISSTTETDVDLIVANNFQLTVWLYSFCHLHGIPLIYASSAATYGDGSLGFVNISTSCVPSMPTGGAKTPSINSLPMTAALPRTILRWSD